MQGQDAVVVLGGEMNHHRSEKRLATAKNNLTSLSCGWARVCGPRKPDHLLYTMENRYCIKCNRMHWFFLEPMEFVEPKLDPRKFTTSELEEMGYFDQNHDSK